jgi:hypothetical protein
MSEKDVKESKKVTSILSARRTIPTSSYDLLEGTFKIATKARNAGIIILSLSIIIFSYFLVSGLLTESRVKSIKSKVEAVKAEKLKVSAELGVVEGFPDVSPLTLLNKQTRVTKDIYELGVAQASTFQVLDNLKSTMVNGILLRSINFCSSEPSTTGDCGATDQKATQGKIVKVGYIAIDFAVEDLAIASQWVSNIKQMAWVTDVKYSVAGKNVKIYATLVPDLFPQESLNTVKSLGFNLQVNSTPPLAEGNTQ